MKLRTPGRVFIPTMMFSIVGIMMMVSPVTKELKPGFFGFFQNTWNHFTETFSNGIAITVLLISFLMLMIINIINKLIEQQKFKKLSSAQQQKFLELSKQSYFTRLINSAKHSQSKEEEEAIILDHGFDGIKELDNSLPQWWLALFHMGNIIMVVYLLAYSFTDFAHPIAEYEKADAIAQEKVDNWVKNNDITIDQAENKYTDAQALAIGKEAFDLHCVTCHSEDGSGGIGPNLTDGSWINKVQDDLYKNIYDIVYNGSPNDPSMRPFGAKGELTGLAIEKVASYVYYLNQEAPEVTASQGGAAPQGNKVAAWARKN